MTPHPHVGSQPIVSGGGSAPSIPLVPQSLSPPCGSASSRTSVVLRPARALPDLRPRSQHPLPRCSALRTGSLLTRARLDPKLGKRLRKRGCVAAFVVAHAQGPYTSEVTDRYTTRALVVAAAGSLSRLHNGHGARRSSARTLPIEGLSSACDSGDPSQIRVGQYSFPTRIQTGRSHPVSLEVQSRAVGVPTRGSCLGISGAVTPDDSKPWRSWSPIPLCPVGPRPLPE